MFSFPHIIQINLSHLSCVLMDSSSEVQLTSAVSNKVAEDGNTQNIYTPLQGRASCAFRGAIPQSLVVTSAYLSSCCLFMVSNQFARCGL